MKLPSKEIERKLLEDYDFVVGVDEVGVGCLAGPVVACAVAFDKVFFNKTHEQFDRLRDSKLLSARQREKFSEELKKEEGLRFEISLSEVGVIDRINIYQAAKLTMLKAVKALQLKEKAMILVDGPAKIPGWSGDQEAIVKGDQKVFAIACASILAKVYRDKLMTEYAERFPGYGFEQHKGYGTKLHLEQLTALGPCSLHRRSFAPVAALL
ncbi:MAG: ribonuclease HII [bacterium]|nr:ribonuclease HII [bacterium]